MFTFRAYLTINVIIDRKKEVILWFNLPSLFASLQVQFMFMHVDAMKKIDTGVLVHRPGKKLHEEQSMFRIRLKRDARQSFIAESTA